MIGLLILMMMMMVMINTHTVARFVIASDLELNDASKLGEQWT